MFDFVAKHKKAIMIVLFLLIIPPFALFGIDSYFHGGGGPQSIATVGDHVISQNEFERSLRERQDAVRRMLGGKVDPAMLDSAELRFAVVDSLVRERLLVDQAARLGLTVTDAQLQAIINEIPAFRDGDKFSYDRYREVLRTQGMTPPVFEGRLRQEVLTQQLSDVFGATAFVSRTVAARLVQLSEQQREVSQYTIAAERHAAGIKIEADAARKYYDSRQDEFRVPEQARIEYAVLSAESLSRQIAVNAEEVRKLYESRKAEFETPETRAASHILILAEANAAPEEKKKALAKAQEIHAQLKQNPGRFADLAKQHSQDPGSAAKGGDLGSFPKGAMVPAFDNAVFGMKPGEVSPPVESQFGYHVIRLNGITPGKLRTFDEVRSQIEEQLRRQAAAKKFAEVAEAFSNKAFEDSESLKGAAEIAKSEVRQSGWLTRAGAPEQLLNNPRLLQAVFSDEALKARRNTEAIEVGNGMMIAARVIEHKPSAVRPFEEVKAGIEKQLEKSRANQLAAQEGRDLLAKLRKGEAVAVTWGAAQSVTRNDAKALPDALMKAAFRADAAKLPSYTGVENPEGGYTLLRVTKVSEPEKPSIERQNVLAQGMQQVLAQEDFGSYVNGLKQRGKVQIRQELLEKKQ